MRTVIALVVSLLAVSAAAQKLTLLHFSDYHSHALPFYSEGRDDQGGIARAIEYLEGEKKRGALVFSGGDMINKGSPAWSDKYTCAEWSWLNGIVDAMAFGNHDPDYGKEEFDRCRASVRYPILSANTSGMRPYVVFVRKGVRIGVFALAGADFRQLVKVSAFTYADPVNAARDVVRALRVTEHVDAVVMIGHEDYEDDLALAHAVPGIDLIFGSHSHRKEALTRIAGTKTWFISPFQYLTYISRVVLTFDDRKLVDVTGELVRIDSNLRADRTVASNVARMQRELEADPQYRDLFKVIARLKAPLSVEELGNKTVGMMRSLTNADVALSTTSSFRQPLPGGPITAELLRAAMPYENEIVVAEMTGERLQQLLDKASDVYVARPTVIDASRTYRIATTDYVTGVEFREFFNDVQKTGMKVRGKLESHLEN
ncbi:MAG TPA: 5'-nucleotidase C-terminal domain-containing protein [Thermoanaerobaculia bacterium]|nr:5'-nucleotidase C-terminal domain-containing protein [Thermoanaerobaculia bacterium]